MKSFRLHYILSLAVTLSPYNQCQVMRNTCNRGCDSDRSCRTHCEGLYSGWRSEHRGHRGRRSGGSSGGSSVGSRVGCYHLPGNGGLHSTCRGTGATEDWHRGYRGHTGATEDQCYLHWWCVLGRISGGRKAVQTKLLFLIFFLHLQFPFWPYLWV